MSRRSYLIACSALLTTLLLSSCASAPPPVANSAQEPAKPAQEAPKSDVYQPKQVRLILSKLDEARIKMCNADSSWASTVILQRERGVSLPDMVKTLDAVDNDIGSSGQSSVNRMRLIAGAIYRSDRPVRTAAELRDSCLMGYGLTEQ